MKTLFFAAIALSITGCANAPSPARGHWSGSGHARDAITIGNIARLERSEDFDVSIEIDATGALAGTLTLRDDESLSEPGLPRRVIRGMTFESGIGGRLVEPAEPRTLPLTGHVHGDEIRFDAVADSGVPLEFALRGDARAGRALIGRDVRGVVESIGVPPLAPIRRARAIVDGGTATIDSRTENASLDLTLRRAGASEARVVSNP